MKKRGEIYKVAVFCILVCVHCCCFAQELFPNTESANAMPKGALDVKLANEIYSDASVTRAWQGLSFNYGVAANMSISETFSFSNHHGYQLPLDFIMPSPEGLYTLGYVKGVKQPYSFENFVLEGKWSFYHNDGEKRHLRVAAYLKLAGGNEPHEAAEKSLMGDNSGAELGFILSYLDKKFAMSLNAGCLETYPYKAGDTVTINYGGAFTYSLSFGYQLLPYTYSNYKQIGLNMYVEVMGEEYAPVSIYENGEQVNTSNAPSLAKGSYLQIAPGIQLIINSNTNLSFSAALLAAGISYERSYPLYLFSLKHTFYLW